MDVDLRKLDLLHAVRSVEGVGDYASSMDENFSIRHTLQRVRLRTEKDFYASWAEMRCWALIYTRLKRDWWRTVTPLTTYIVNIVSYSFVLNS